MTTSDTTARMLTVEEVARRLRVGRATIYRLCRQEHFPSARVGQQIRVPENALEQWIAEGGLTPQDEANER